MYKFRSNEPILTKWRYWQMDGRTNEKNKIQRTEGRAEIPKSNKKQIKNNHPYIAPTCDVFRHLIYISLLYAYCTISCSALKIFEDIMST